jgi:uncharacterized membrane protein
MKARATLLGHPIHQMLIVVPLGLYVIAVVFDVITMFRPIEELSIASFWNIVAGSIGAVVAALFGVIDWTKIPAGTRAKRIGIFHAVANVAVLGLFVAAAAMRSDNPAYFVSTTALVLELVAFALGGLAGFWGGELVDRFGIGVHEGAHPDAPRERQRPPGLGDDRRPFYATHPSPTRPVA